MLADNATFVNPRQILRKTKFLQLISTDDIISLQVVKGWFRTMQ